MSGSSISQSLSLFNSRSHTLIDTAPTYPLDSPGASEAALGQADIPWARISTKVSAVGERANSLEKVRSGLERSLERLGGKAIDIFYFHIPDIDTPLEEQARAMDEACRAGKVKRWGVSNFSPGQVEELMEIVEREGEFFWFRVLCYEGKADLRLVCDRIREAECASRTVQSVC